MRFLCLGNIRRIGLLLRRPTFSPFLPFPTVSLLLEFAVFIQFNQPSNLPTNLSTNLPTNLLIQTHPPTIERTRMPALL